VNAAPAVRELRFGQMCTSTAGHVFGDRWSVTLAREHRECRVLRKAPIGERERAEVERRAAVGRDPFDVLAVRAQTDCRTVGCGLIRHNAVNVSRHSRRRLISSALERLEHWPSS